MAVTPPEQVRPAVDAARVAQEGWARLELDGRFSALKEAAAEMLRRRSEIVDLVRLEMGKLEVDGMFTEGLGPLDSLKGWTRVVRAATARERVRLNPLAFPRKRAYVDLVPRGVIGVIAPWNFPVAGLYRSVFPALLTGNAVVVKPSEYTPRSSRWFLDQLAPFLPAGLVATLPGGPATGAAIVESGVDAVVFTGSTAAGRSVAGRAAALGIPCSAEMGGKDAAIVFSDADLERATAGLTQWALQNAGQSCGAIEVVYADSAIADELVARLSRAWSALRPGPGAVGEVDVAPLAHAAQLDTVEAHVADALSRGAELVVGGERHGPGFGYLPTLLDRCRPGMRVVEEETFGPVLAICRVDSPAEAIRRVNEAKYGLTCSLWTEDAHRAERLAERIDVGVVSINNHGMTGAIPELPWSGTRGTGFGVAGSRHALLTFVRPRAVLVDNAKSPDPYWLPYDPDAWHIADLLADVQIGRVERAWRLPGLLRSRIRSLRTFYRRR